MRAKLMRASVAAALVAAVLGDLIWPHKHQ